MVLATEEDLGVISIRKGDVFTPRLPRDFVVRQRLNFGKASFAAGQIRWETDDFKDTFTVQEETSSDSLLKSELDAWQAAGDEALVNLEASLAE